MAKLMADISLLCFLRIMKPLDSYLPLEKGPCDENIDESIALENITGVQSRVII